MIDVESHLREQLTPRAADGALPNWDDVLERAGEPRRRLRRRTTALVIAAALLVALGATPLGAGIVRSVGDFSSWLRGTPGEPVSAEEQREFDETNAKSWAAFPGSPQLRELTSIEADGISYRLVGFRSGNSLCIRVKATGEATGSTLRCAPVDDLERDSAPVRVLLADWGVGRGEKKRTIGFDTVPAPRAQVTAGIAADGVTSVELVDGAGAHQVETHANSFLYVAERPDVGQRVTHVRAHLESGATTGVPFTQSPFGMGGGIGSGNGRPGGPTQVERKLSGGEIGWLERREERGEPLNVLPHDDALHFDPEFGRVLTPDPASAKRMAVMLTSTPLPGPRVPGDSVCWLLLIGRTSSGSCSGAGQLFADIPFTFSFGFVGAGAQYGTFSGIASDEVARLEIFTANGRQIDVALRDNAFLADVALSHVPAKLVAYDREGRVIGIRKTPTNDEGPATPVGEPIVDRTLELEGVGSVRLRAHHTTEGGTCGYIRGTGTVSVSMGGCVPEKWTEAPVRISTLGNPPAFLVGQVRADIDQATVVYAGGFQQRVNPDPHGFVLETVPTPQRKAANRVVEIRGVAADGTIVDRQRIPPPGR